MFCVAGYAQRHADELNGDVPNYVGDSPGGTFPQWPAPGVAPAPLKFADLAVGQAGIPPPFVPVIPDTPQILMLSYRCMVKTSVTGIVR
jgi:hypothetical protein